MYTFAPREITYTTHLYIVHLYLLLSLLCIIFYCTSQSLQCFAIYNILHFYNKLTKTLIPPTFIRSIPIPPRHRTTLSKISCKRSYQKNWKKWHLLISSIINYNRCMPSHDTLIWLIECFNLFLQQIRSILREKII